MRFNPPEFESHGGRLEAFDDGHCPETFRFHTDDENNENDTNTVTPRIVRYDDIIMCQSSSQSKSTSPSSSVHIYDNILNPYDARTLYQVTAVGESPWGTYVKTTEALEWIEWKKRDAEKCNTPSHTSTSSIDEHLVDWRLKMLRFRQWRNLREGKMDEVVPESDGCHNQLDDMDCIRHALAVEAVATFFIELIPSQAGSITLSANSSSNQSARRKTLYELPSFLKQVHGFAVWALSSIAGQSVSYHIDYAELLRYEYNVTVPPLWAGTIQCSNLRNRQKVDNDNARSGEHIIMEGGEFCVNLRGLDHYAEHGYKGNLSGDPTGGWKRPEGEDACAQYVDGGVHINDEDQWVTIPYSFNRGIVHHGDLPHLSAPITSISTHENGVSRKSRVIVGFNAFGHDVGAQVAKAPEHSKLFRRKVRLYRSTINSAKGTKLGHNGRVQDGMNLSQIRQNKGLMKLLVLAKREKVKLELRRNQEQLSLRIWQRLLRHYHHQHTHDNTRLLLRLSDIVDEFGSRNDGVDGAWPNSTDVHVHLHHMLVSTRKLDGGCRNMFLDKDGVWYCMQAASLDSSVSSSPGATSSEPSLFSRLTPLSTYLCIHPTSSNITN